VWHCHSFSTRGSGFWQRILIRDAFSAISTRASFHCERPSARGRMFGSGLRLPFGSRSCRADGNPRVSRPAARWWRREVRDEAFIFRLFSLGSLWGR